jgi:hypothetical protein
MFFRCLAVIAAVLITVNSAYAGWNKWSSEVKKDPFTGGEKVFLGFSPSTNSSLSIKCDTSKTGIEVRSIPGWRGDDSLTDRQPTIKLAIDGDLLFTNQTIATSVGLYGGDYLIGISAMLDQRQSQEFIARFVKAKRQIAMDDGMSTGPTITTARGSTKSGRALIKCLGKQVTTGSKSKVQGNKNSKSDPSGIPNLKELSLMARSGREGANAAAVIFHTIMVGSPYCGFEITPLIQKFPADSLAVAKEDQSLGDDNSRVVKLARAPFEENTALGLCKELAPIYLDARFGSK